jgi:hypothetical protein
VYINATEKCYTSCHVYTNATKLAVSSAYHISSAVMITFLNNLIFELLLRKQLVLLDKQNEPEAFTIITEAR